MAPLQEHDHAGFKVSVAVHLIAQPTAHDVPPRGTVKVVGGWGGAVGAQTIDSDCRWRRSTGKAARGNVVTTVVTVELVARAADIKLWWPNNMGGQPLYAINASFIPAAPVTPTVHAATKQIGFREFAMVTINDTDPMGVATASAPSVEGSGNHTVAWRVNGALVFARGANVVPMEELEGRSSAAATRSMMESAAEGNLNTLRIWAGAVYFQDLFYNLADTLGLMVYHDLMFIEQGHAPCCPFYACTSSWSCAGHAYNATCSCTGAVAQTQKAEIQHQIRRLGNHPSIVLWDACNECGGYGIYADFVMKTVAEEDKSRAVWPSSPSNGWVRGVNRLNGRPLASPPSPDTGLPTAAPLVASGGQFPHNSSNPCTACQCGTKGCSTAESHGPYIGGSGWFTNAGVLAHDLLAHAFSQSLLVCWLRGTRLHLVCAVCADHF